MLALDDAEVGVDGRHARFNVYCVNCESLNVEAVSLTPVCTTQTSEETSTATHLVISRHSFRQFDIDVYGCNVPFGDATPSCLFHV